MTTTPPSFSQHELLEIAKRQKSMIWLVLASIFAIFVPFLPLVTGILGLIYIYLLAKAFKSRVAWLYALIAFLPIIGLIALLVANGKATSILQVSGIPVGFMGVKRKDLERLAQAEP